MKGGYGRGTHDSKVEDYGKYKEKQFKSYKKKLDEQIDNISSCSLNADDKVLLLEELKNVIDKRIIKRIN